MKLNILKNICLGGLILLSATSCEDFLTEKPQTFQRHHLMVPHDTERIRHFHQFQYHLNRMLTPV